MGEVDVEEAVVVKRFSQYSCSDFCVHRGKCVRNKCDLNKGWHGLNCDFQMACPVIGHNKTIGNFPYSYFPSVVIHKLVF